MWSRIQRCAVAVHQDGGEHAVAREHPGEAHTEWPHPGHVPDIKVLEIRLIEIRRDIAAHGGAFPMLSKVFRSDVHVHMRTLATVNTGHGIVEIPANQFREGIGSALGSRPLIRGSVRGRFRHRQPRESRQQHFTSECIEITLDRHPTVERRSNPQDIEVIALPGGAWSDSKIRSRTAIAYRSLMVVASTPDAAANRVFMQDGNALSGMPFGGDSQNAAIIAT